MKQKVFAIGLLLLGLFSVGQFTDNVIEVNAGQTPTGSPQDPQPPQGKACDISLDKVCKGHGWNANLHEDKSHTAAMSQCQNELQTCVENFSDHCKKVCGDNHCAMILSKSRGKCEGKCYETYCEADGERKLNCKCSDPI